MSYNNVSKDSLNEIANRYHLNDVVDDKQFDSTFHYLCFKWVVGALNQGDRVLEMGFGEGNVTNNLLKAKMKVEIVEGAKVLAEKAKKIYGDGVVVHHDLFENFKPNQRFDCILATNILEHVDDPRTTLEAVSRWCNNETLLVVSVPNSESFHRRLAVLMGLQPTLDTLSPRDHLVGHQRVYSREMLLDHIDEAGFEVIAQKGFLLKALPNSMMADFSPELIQALYKIADELPVEYSADMGFMLRKK